MARTIDSIAIHTYAVKGNLTVDQVRKSQMRERGFSDYAYHFGIQKDGTIESGRDIETVGAGVYGHNARSLHVALAGHGDFEPHTPLQSFALSVLLASLLDRYPLARIVGHREFPGVAKTCPGTLVDMLRVRADAQLARDLRYAYIPDHTPASRILAGISAPLKQPDNLSLIAASPSFKPVSPSHGAFVAYAVPRDGGPAVSGVLQLDGTDSRPLEHYLVRSYPDATKVVVCTASSLIAVEDAYLPPQSRAWIDLVRICYNRS